MQPARRLTTSPGQAPGVAQDLVDHLVHELQLAGGDRAGPPGRAEELKVGVELADDRLGQGLAQLVLVGVVVHAVPGRGAERVGHRGHQPAGPAVPDDLAELVDHQVAVPRGI